MSTLVFASPYSPGFLVVVVWFFSRVISILLPFSVVLCSRSLLEFSSWEAFSSQDSLVGAFSGWPLDEPESSDGGSESGPEGRPSGGPAGGAEEPPLAPGPEGGPDSGSVGFWDLSFQKLLEVQQLLPNKSKPQNIDSPYKILLISLVFFSSLSDCLKDILYIFLFVLWLLSSFLV